MDNIQTKIWDTLCELDGETVARLFTDWHGNQLMDEGFKRYLQDEGCLEDEEEEEDYYE